MVTKYDEKIRTLTINFEGEIDHHSCSEIAVKSDDAINKYLPNKLIFDFQNVNFMDSAGIGMVIGRYKQTAILGGKMALANLTESVRKIFEMSGVLKLIPEVELSKDYLEENKEEKVI